MSELLIPEESELFKSEDGTEFEALFFSSSIPTVMAGEDLISIRTCIQVDEAIGASIDEGQVVTRDLTGKEYEIKSKRVTGIGLVEVELNDSPRPQSTAEIFGRF